jgi:hypothetical protein
MTLIWRACGLLVAAVGLWAMVWASSAPIAVDGEPRGVLRLAWSARPERIETCVEQSAEALARLPQHMRQPVLCEGVTAQYRLTVRTGGRLVTERIVRGGGLRQDRRLYVFEELALEPGDLAVEVRFDRVTPWSGPPASEPLPEAHAAAAPSTALRHQPAADAVPARLVFDEHIGVRPWEVVLITYSPEQKRLVAVTPPPTR